MDRLRHVLRAGILFCAACFVTETAPRPEPLRFRADDPLWREPAPISVGKLTQRKIDDAYDQLEKTFWRPGKPGPEGPPPSLGVNTLDEVPDSAWYTNRHGRKRMSMEELLRGPGNERPPSDAGPWTILSAKTEGVTPGFVIRDKMGRRYMLKFDTPRFPNATSAADVIGSKIFYALGYYTPENYIVLFPRQQLVVGDKATVTDITGRKRRMTAYDVDSLLARVNRTADGRYRALASLFIEGELLGPWLYHGTRSDDPNDIFPHEHRRDLRGLYVFAAWVNHYDATSLNTLDTVLEEDGVRYVRHYLLDFGSILGSSGVGARDPRNGFVYQYDFSFAWKQALTLGLWVPKWQRAHYPNLPEAGRFESDAFDPEGWKPIYPNPAFENRLPGDTFWAAKQVMAFTDEEIRALVKLGQYEDPRATEHVTQTLIARRDKIGRTYFSKVLPLDDFRVRNGQLEFTDLAEKYGFRGSLQLKPSWFEYDNAEGVRRTLPGDSFSLPPETKELKPGSIVGVTIYAEDPARRMVDVFLRKTSEYGWDVVGIRR